MSGKERMLSVVGAAVAGTSRLFEKRGGTEALHAVERCMKRMTRGVDSFHGRVVQAGRDEIIAVFNNASDACQASIAMQRRVADLPPVSGIQLAIRVGFHHGAGIEEGAEVLGDCLITAEYLAGLAVAGQVLTSGETQALLSPQLRLSTRRLEYVPAKSLSTDRQVFEVCWLDESAKTKASKVVVVPPAVATKGRDLRLCIRYGGYVKLLDNHRSSVVMGRDAGCEIVVRDPRASRNHARVDRRGEHFVLSDLSTNGTFVTVTGEHEVFLKREELVLRGSGIISFAASANSPSADIAEFEHL
jgi:class 3 adenylate cyclase